ncbi:sensor histidine kinase [Pedobacter vanadiisoli]|uniref:histidine kinase n=1 Tax=Pedobacter vanadiisoli TaxID=1761975 RepID=A0ABW5MMT0_9SPHI
MGRLSIFCLLFFSYQTTFAQLLETDKRYPDSLQYVVKHAGTDSLKAIANFALSRHWGKQRDDKKANDYLAEGRKKSKNSRYLYALYLYSAGINSAYQDKGAAVAKNFLLKADSIFAYTKTKECNLLRAKLWNNYSILLSRENKQQQSIDILLNKVIPLARASGDVAMEGVAYHAVAVFMDLVAQSEKASVYFKKSITILENIKTDTVRLARAYNNSARNSMVRNKFKEAGATIEKARLLFKNHTNIPSYVYFCGFESYYLLMLKQYGKSLKALNKGLETATRLKLTKERNDLLIQKYNILNAQQNYEEGKNVILEIIKSDSNTYIENKATHYKQASESYELLENLPEAFKWLKKYTLLRDSANNIRLKEEVNALEIKFKAAENQKKIADLNLANQKANLSAKNSRLLNWLLSVVSLLVLSVSIFAVYYYYNQKKLATQREEIRLSNAMLQGQETERYRVARDLHDGLGNLLTVIKFNLGQLVKEKPAAELNEIAYQLDHSISELRRIAHDMIPEMLLNIGLEAALKDLCESLTSDNLEIDCQLIKIKNTIPQQIQVSIYRIIQELLTNVVKHAQARNVLLQCTQQKNIFFITLEDDGRGFDTNQQKEKAGIGLNNIKSRVAYLNGKMEIVSHTDQPGTSINIELNVKA